MISQVNPFAFCPVYASLDLTPQRVRGDFRRIAVKGTRANVIPVMFWEDAAQSSVTSVTIYNAETDAVLLAVGGGSVTVTQASDASRTWYTWEWTGGAFACNYVYLRFLLGNGSTYYTHVIQLQASGSEARAERFYLEVSDTRGALGDKYYPSGFSERFYFDGHLADQTTEQEDDVLITGDGTRRVLSSDAGYFASIVVETVPEPLFAALRMLNQHDTITLHRVNPSASWAFTIPQETTFEVRPRDGGYVNQGVLRYAVGRMQVRNFRVDPTT